MPSQPNRGHRRRCGSGLPPAAGTGIETPEAYLITFRCYGTWLHGDGRGSTDREYRVFGAPFAPPDEAREKWEYAELKQPPVNLTVEQRGCVAQTLREVCEYRGWRLVELAVLPDHAHVLVAAACPPERVLNAFKSWATRRLVERGLIARGQRVWSRHGSTRYLWTEAAVDTAWRYVREGQRVEPPAAGSAARPDEREQGAP